MSNIVGNTSGLLGNTVMTSTHHYEDGSNAIFAYIEACNYRVETHQNGFSVYVKSGEDRVHLHFMDTEISELLAAVGKNIAELQDRLTRED
jgi:hypothetical protein